MCVEVGAKKFGMDQMSVIAFDIVIVPMCLDGDGLLLKALRSESVAAASDRLASLSIE